MNPLRRLLFGIAIALLAWAAAAMGWRSRRRGKGPYQSRREGWFFKDTRIEGADERSFEPLNDSFARDARTGYYRAGAIPGSDGASFQALSDHDARDRARVWRGETYRKGQEYWMIRHERVFEVVGADPASYRHVGEDYTADARRVYFEGQPFPVRDPASFALLGGGYARDAQRAYYDRVEIPGSDGASFARVDERDVGYARDRQRVYHGHTEINVPGKGPHPVVRVLAGVDPAVFRVLGRDYAGDGQRVFHDGALLKDADAASFQVIDIADTRADQADAQDRKGLFSRGRRLGAPAPAAGAAPAPPTGRPPRSTPR